MLNKLISMEITNASLLLSSKDNSELEKLLSEARLKYSQAETVKNKIVIMGNKTEDNKASKEELENHLLLLYTLLQKLEDITNIILTLLEERK